MGMDVIRVHIPFGTVISHILVFPERYEWLYVAHSRLSRPEAFTQDLLKLLARYQSKAKTLNPRGRKLKLANHWVTLPLLQQALERTFLSKTELFGSPLEFFMTNDISYY